jgi:hypothetical protein
MVAGGWVQTADTGQIDFATQAKPAGANTDAGYVVMRMNDVHQALRPVYVRLTFGSRLLSADLPQMFTELDLSGREGGPKLRGEKPLANLEAGRKGHLPREVAGFFSVHARRGPELNDRIAVAPEDGRFRRTKLFQPFSRIWTFASL